MPVINFLSAQFLECISEGFVRIAVSSLLTEERTSKWQGQRRSIRDWYLPYQQQNRIRIRITSKRPSFLGVEVGEIMSYGSKDTKPSC